MTHLDPFSYVQRLSIILVTLILVFVINHCCGFRFFKRLRKKRDLKFHCFLLVLLYCIDWLVYDFIVTINLFYVENPEFIGASNITVRDIRYVCDGILDLAFTAHSSLMFLLVAFFHTLFSKSMSSAQFVSKWEFKLYVGYSLASVLLYPVIQWSLIREDPRLPTVVPQFLWFGEISISTVLFLVILYRMKKYERRMKSTPNNPSISETLTLIDLLSKLVIALILANTSDSWSLTIINIAYIIPTVPPVPNAPLALTSGVKNFFTGLFSISHLMVMVIVVLILNCSIIAQYIHAVRNTNSKKPAEMTSLSTYATSVDSV